jgi:hypothetical protein
MVLRYTSFVPSARFLADKSFDSPMYRKGQRQSLSLNKKKTVFQKVRLQRVSFLMEVPVVVRAARTPTPVTRVSSVELLRTSYSRRRKVLPIGMKWKEKQPNVSPSHLV